MTTINWIAQNIILSHTINVLWFLCLQQADQLTEEQIAGECIP